MSSKLPDGKPYKPGHSSDETDEKQIVRGKYFEPSYSYGNPLNLKPRHLSLLKSHDEWGSKSKDMMRKVSEIMETKAMLHFISSYHVKLLECVSADELPELISEHERLLNEFLKGGPLPSIKLPAYYFCGQTYIPQGWVIKLEEFARDSASEFKMEQWDNVSVVPQMPSWAMRSAIVQASKSILEANTRQIAISGQEAGKVVKSLKHMPEIQSKFDIVLYISASQDQSIEEVDKCIEEQIDKLIEANTSLVSLVEEKTYNSLLLFDSSGAKSIDPQILETLMDRDYTCLVLAIPRKNIYKTVGVDMVIMMEHHLLPLELFFQYASSDLYQYSSSADKQVALDFIEQCDGDLVAVVLLAKELGFQSKDVWQGALDELKMNRSSEIEKSGFMAAFHFIWKRKDLIKKLCLRWVANYSNGEGLTTSSMVSSWLADGLVQTQEEGVELCIDLAKSGLLEHKPSDTIIMNNQFHDFLLKYVIQSMGSPLTARAITEDAEFINLNNSEVRELPDSPVCSQVVVLCLQSNRNIMVIPPSFFQHMPLLLTLNLSHTSIKTLPASISAAVSLRNLILRGCDLFLELPPEVGTLSELEVIDLEGTRITHLPDEIAQLRKLQSLKLSFYACGEDLGRSKQWIPESVLSILKVLWIGVDPDADAGVDEWIPHLQKLSCYKNLSSIMLHVSYPTLLKDFPRNIHYKLIVGRCGQRMISRIPYEVEEKFKQQPRYLKYVNSKRAPTEVKKILEYCNAFILDRHWTVNSLSEFSNGTLHSLKFCLLVECNELKIIFDEHNTRYLVIEDLYIYYMKNLRSIWSSEVTASNYFFRLKYLNLCTCMLLDSVFSISLVGGFRLLEELVVEDCPKIESLVSRDCARVHQEHYFLPRLKKISLRELPELVTISHGIEMVPELEKLVIFYCPKLQSISELIGGNLKVVKGETEWWDSLSWKETDPLANYFVPLQKDGDLMAQFTED